MSAKSILSSKTFWVNVTAIVGALSGFFTGEVDLTTAGTAVGMAVVNIVMRFVTKTPVVGGPQ